MTAVLGTAAVILAILLVLSRHRLEQERKIAQNERKQMEAEHEEQKRKWERHLMETEEEKIRRLKALLVPAENIGIYVQLAEEEAETDREKELLAVIDGENRKVLEILERNENAGTAGKLQSDK